MEMVLQRLTNNNRFGTFGKLYIDGEAICDTLEPANLDGKYNHAVLSGSYPVEFTYSPKFGTSLPLLAVPHRSAIRIHAGNYVKDSRGCILVGRRDGNYLANSRSALIYLVNLMRLNHVDVIIINPIINTQTELQL